MPTPPDKPHKKKPKLTTASFAHNGYMLVEEAPPFDPRQIQFMKKKDLQRYDDEPEPKKGSVLLSIGGGLFIGLLLLMFTVNVLLPAWNGLQAQWHYGDAHISHYEQSGHHFIGEVYQGFVTVYDILEGHPEKAQTFMLQSATDNAVVQFETRDVNNDGIPDVTVGTKGSPIGVTLYGTKDNSFAKQPPESTK
ncbi:hypothetical protein Krac_8987 [Ktedonobacter racemifer DSM 44963]|uniref:VCBS repeat-containing protein n=2 Tax=Ktedonobacter racemifer TaxID=363277 RepID=D6TQH6_KTERA|nr:hypothetical protein Krac_8987 [Ktedonobacter racemifer DSM 44963]